MKGKNSKNKPKSTKNTALPLDIQQKIARLDAFTTHNPRPVVEVSYDGNVLDQNKSAKNIFPDLGKKGSKHIFLSDLDKVVKFLSKEKRPFRREIQVGGRWYKQVFYPIPQFNMIHIYCSDATERMQAEKELEESRKRYHMLFEKMNYGYALQDIIYDNKGNPIDYKFIDVNPAFEKLSRVKREVIVGKTANQIARKPETQESIELRKKYDKVAITGKPAYFENYNEVTKKYFELYAYKPSQTQMALIFSDITDRKKTDEEKNNFISIMSHELRNPLTPIMAHAQFLQRQSFNDPIIKESIGVIEKQSKIMADLLNDILDVSRLSRHQIKLKKSRINVYDVIQSSVKSAMPFITTKQQELSMLLPKNPVYIYADPLRLEQVLVNVLNNASKYTHPKGRINIYCESKKGNIEIRIKDNGEGMTPDKISRIFDLFKGENQPFMGIGGLGIGLNLVKNLVRMHKGTVEVSSKGLGKGSEFIINLPTRAQNAPKTIAETENTKNRASDTNHQTLRILVVDDNADIRNAISNILSHEGYEIKSTHDGAQAIKISKTFKPDAALIDIGLPGISGYKVAQILRERYNNQRRKIKLIAFTGYGQEKDKIKAKEAGFDAHFTKPVNIDHLIRFLS